MKSTVYITNSKGNYTTPSRRLGANEGLNLIRYADDFIVTAPSREKIIRYVLPKLRGFLKERGMELNKVKTKPEVGGAVLKVISMIDRIQSGIKYAPLLGHCNAVQFIDEVDQTEQRLYLWHGNILRRVQELNDVEFESIEKLIEKEKERRGI